MPRRGDIVYLGQGRLAARETMFPSHATMRGGEHVDQCRFMPGNMAGMGTMKTVCCPLGTMQVPGSNSVQVKVSAWIRASASGPFEAARRQVQVVSVAPGWRVDA